MSVIVVGLNHRTAPLELLERVAVTADRLPKALAGLRDRESIGEAVLLSTCMRTEIYATAERFHPAVQDIRNYLCELSFSAPEDLSDHLTMLYDDAAMGHLFAVVSGIESAVLGESEVQSQVRQAWETARTEQAAGPVLSALFRHALEVGKRARSETAIARGTTSVSQAAVALAEHHLGGPLDGRRVLVLGAGEMGEGMAVVLARSGAGEVLVANRTAARAAALADRIGARTVPMEELPGVLREVDVLLASTGASEPLVSAADLAGRDGRPLLVVDVAVPRDVDPAAKQLDGVTVLDLDDLRAFTRRNLEERRRELARVHSIIDEEVAVHLGDVQERQAAPTIAKLHARAEAIRGDEVGRLRLDDEQRDEVEILTRRIVAKLLHEPTVRLKGAAGTPRGERLAETLRALFDLDEE